MLRERPAELGECLVVITQISQAIVMLQGAVVRVEARTDGTYGLGVAVKRHQIFSLKKIAPLKSTRALAETQAVIS